MAKPIVYGTPLSPFVRAVRAALVEKGVEYDHVDVSVLEGECGEPEHLKRNPFGKVPVFDHDDIRIYETGAIVRYIDDVFDGAKLTPGNAKARAHMNQAIGILDSFGYDAMVLDVVAYHFFPDLIGGKDDERLAKGKEQSALCLKEFTRLMDGNPWLAGDDITLADLSVAPHVFYLTLVPEGEDLFGGAPEIKAWWDKLAQRDSMTQTAPPL